MKVYKNLKNIVFNHPTLYLSFHQIIYCLAPIFIEIAPIFPTLAPFSYKNIAGSSYIKINIWFYIKAFTVFYIISLIYMVTLYRNFYMIFPFLYWDRKCCPLETLNMAYVPYLFCFLYRIWTICHIYYSIWKLLWHQCHILYSYLC